MALLEPGFVIEGLPRGTFTIHLGLAISSQRPMPPASAGQPGRRPTAAGPSRMTSRTSLAAMIANTSVLHVLEIERFQIGVADVRALELLDQASMPHDANACSRLLCMEQIMRRRQHGDPGLACIDEQFGKFDWPPMDQARKSVRQERGLWHSSPGRWQFRPFDACPLSMWRPGHRPPGEEVPPPPADQANAPAAAFLQSRARRRKRDFPDPKGERRGSLVRVCKRRGVSSPTVAARHQACRFAASRMSVE